MLLLVCLFCFVPSSFHLALAIEPQRHHRHHPDFSLLARRGGWMQPIKRKSSSSSGVAAAAVSSSAGAATAKDHSASTPPIVWTIAGSDSGGGAGIQADLLAMHTLGCHGCSVITALTAQNSNEVRSVEPSSIAMLQASFAVLQDDLPPKAIKLGMLATAEIVEEVAHLLEQIVESSSPPAVICDPVMVTTSGSILLDGDARKLMINRIFPHATLITPNKQEAEVLVGYQLKSPKDVEKAAKELLSMGKSKAVLIKGGHSFRGDEDEEGKEVAQDYLLESQSIDEEGGAWITSPRVQNPNTHGTGCTLASAIASFIAQDHPLEDAVILGKAYVNQGIRSAVRLGKGPGPVRQTGWPSQSQDFPWMTSQAEDGLSAKAADPFASCEEAKIGLYACVDSADWIERLVDLGVMDIQIRIKDKAMEEIDEEIAKAARVCSEKGARLWVNDYWELALKHATYGLHIGQEDLASLLQSKTSDASKAPLRQIQHAGIRLGISTHTFGELARAVALRPSYISLGPIYPTGSKKVAYGPQGVERISQWRALIEGLLVVIGGISLETASSCVKAGADGICVISALTKAPDLAHAVKTWIEVFDRSTS